MVSESCLINKCVFCVNILNGEGLIFIIMFFFCLYGCFIYEILRKKNGLRLVGWFLEKFGILEKRII